MTNILLVGAVLAFSAIARSVLAEMAGNQGHTAYSWLASFMAGACLLGAFLVVIVGYAATKVPL